MRFGDYEKPVAEVKLGRAGGDEVFVATLNHDYESVEGERYVFKEGTVIKESAGDFNFPGCGGYFIGEMDFYFVFNDNIVKPEPLCHVGDSSALHEERDNCDEENHVKHKTRFSIGQVCQNESGKYDWDGTTQTDPRNENLCLNADFTEREETDKYGERSCGENHENAEQ